MKKFVFAIAMIGMGGMAMAQQTLPQDKESKRSEMRQKFQEREKEHLDKMQRDLNLNASQVAQIKALHEKRKAEMKADFDRNKDQRQAKMQEMKAKKERMDADMKQILTPQQYNQWQADRKEKMEKHRMVMKDRKMKGGKMQKPMEPQAPGSDMK